MTTVILRHVCDSDGRDGNKSRASPEIGDNRFAMDLQKVFENN